MDDDTYLFTTDNEFNVHARKDGTWVVYDLEYEAVGFPFLLPGGLAESHVRIVCDVIDRLMEVARDNGIFSGRQSLQMEIRKSLGLGE